MMNLDGNIGLANMSWVGSVEAELLKDSLESSDEENGNLVLIFNKYSL